MAELVSLPQGSVIAAARADLRLSADDHPYERVHADAIEANWMRESAANPALYDGRTVLFSRVALDGPVLVGRCHVVRFASLMHWRLAKRSDVAAHLFAMAVPVTRDGAVMAARMGPRTANAGQVYFAGGSLEAPDFVDGVADVDCNMLREVEEETGLDLSACAAEPMLRVLNSESGVVVMRRYRLAEDAAELDRRVRAFVAAERDPEITEPVFLWPGAAYEPAILPWVRQVAEWHFADPLAA
jgi:8-oxo-dGTP pyrophosphatase MutT (NUDIX family)